ncbi:MAG: hypothetical protein JO263_01600 [Candidatus Eremiobacteraeota bacterium]|nr:hypothetical protein [Candidatus Eremiobacteraeota bacterium]
MPTQTQTVKEHLKAFNDQLKAAVDKNDEKAKEHIRTALKHADQAKAELHAYLKADREQTKADAQAALDKLQKATHSAKAAMDAKGADIQTHIKKSLADAKAALEQ